MRRNQGVFLFQKVIAILLLLHAISLFDIDHATGVTMYIAMISRELSYGLAALFVVCFLVIITNPNPIRLTLFLVYCLPQYIYSVFTVQRWLSGDYSLLALFLNPILSVLIVVFSWATLKTYQEVTKDTLHGNHK